MLPVCGGGSGPVIFRSDTGETWCLVITDIVQIIVVTTPGYRDIVRIYYLYNVSFGTNIVITNSDNSSIWVFWAIFTFMLFHLFCLDLEATQVLSKRSQ